MLSRSLHALALVLAAACLRPPAGALPEHAWRYSTPERPSSAHFAARLQRHIPHFDALRLNFRQEDGAPRLPCTQ